MPEVRTLVERAWFQPRTEGAPRRRTSPADLEGLPKPAQESLIALYRECFTDDDPPDDKDLASFVDALGFAEFGIDSAILGGHGQLVRRHAKIADWLEWPQGRFDRLASWWASSSHHRHFSQTT